MPTALIARQIVRKDMRLARWAWVALALCMSPAAQAQQGQQAPHAAKSRQATASAGSGVATDAATIERGRQAYEARCGACHSVQDHRVGPAHQGVFGRKAGSAPGYDYSPALAASKIIWSQANLQAWLTDPETVIAGQRMGYRLGSEPQRNDIIAYLASVSPAKRK